MTQIDDNRIGLVSLTHIRSNSQNGLISLSEHPKLESLYNIARQNFPGNRALKVLGENPKRFDCQQFIEVLNTVWDDSKDINRKLWLSGNKANNSQNWAEVIENLMGNEKPVGERNNATPLGTFIDKLSTLGVNFDTNEIENRMKLSKTLAEFIYNNNFEILLLKSGFSPDKVAEIKEAEIKEATRRASYADIATEIFMRAEAPGFKLDENPFTITHKMPTGHPIKEFLDKLSSGKTLEIESNLQVLAESFHKRYPTMEDAVGAIKESQSFPASSIDRLPFKSEKSSKDFWYLFLLEEHNLYAAKQQEIQGNQAAKNNFFARFLPGA